MGAEYVKSLILHWCGVSLTVAKFSSIAVGKPTRIPLYLSKLI